MRYAYSLMATFLLGFLSLNAQAGSLFIDGVKVGTCQGSTCTLDSGDIIDNPNPGGDITVNQNVNTAVDVVNENNNTNNNTNNNNNTNQQQQQQQQTQTAFGGNVTVGDTTVTSSATGGAATIEEGAVQNSATNTNQFSVAEGAVQNSNTGTNTLNVAEGAVTATGGAGGQGGAGGSANIAEGAVNNTNTVAGGTANATVEEGAVNNTVAGGAGGNASIAEGAVSNSNTNTAQGGDATVEEGAVANNNSNSISEGAVTVNNNFGGEDGDGALATQNVEGSTQVVEGSTTNVQVDARTDFRRAPVASVAPVFSSACSGGASFQARDLGLSVGDAEHYCKLLQLADARFAQAQTIVLEPPQPPVLADCTGNVPDYTKGSHSDTEMQKQATASCFRQNEATMEEYTAVVNAYNEAAADRTALMNNAYELVNEAQEYVEDQEFLSNVSEQSRKLLIPMMAIKAFALLFL